MTKGAALRSALRQAQGDEGLTSGIALALHVVGQMYGKPRADLLARYLEYVPTARPA